MTALALSCLFRPCLRAWLSVSVPAVVLSLVMLPVAGAATAAAPWQIEGPEALTLSDETPALMAAWRITASPALIHRAATQLSLTLPGLGEVEASLTRYFEQGIGDENWQGRLEGDLGEVVLTRLGDRLAGRIEAGSRLFEIRGEPGGGTLLLELDGDGFPECSGGLPAPLDFRDPARRPSAGAVPQPARPEGDTSPMSEVDLLVLYTPMARQMLGGPAAIEAHAAAAVANANTSLINSQIPDRFRIAGMAEIAAQETGNCSADLNALRSSSRAAELREAFGADLVGLISWVSYCGCGYVMRNPGPGFASSAFQVTSTSCAVGNLTYAHEHGHNLGLEHDPANGPAPASASYPWSFGHFVSGQFRTVMSYASPCVGGCPRRMHFSNPDVSLTGAPTGIEGQRDNARTLRATMPIAEQFRSPQPPGQMMITADPLEIRLLEGSTGTERNLTISNSGSGPLLWQARAGQNCVNPTGLAWLGLPAQQGIVPAGQSQSLSIQFSAPNTAPASLSGWLCIQSSDPDFELANLPVGLELLTDPLYQDRFAPVVGP